MGGDYGTTPYGNNPISGQVEGIMSGSVVRLPDFPCIRAKLFAHTSNTETVWVGNVTGTVNGLDGLPLSVAGGGIYFEGISNINLLVCNFDAAGDRLCWLIQRFD